MHTNYDCALVPRIVWLLLDNGAKVSQRNKLGLTALHIAAANGNVDALQVWIWLLALRLIFVIHQLHYWQPKFGILLFYIWKIFVFLTLTQQVFLLEDPDAINYRTEMKETPLFFAVKNDHMKCAEALLRWGASNEVLNLR